MVYFKLKSRFIFINEGKKNTRQITVQIQFNLQKYTFSFQMTEVYYQKLLVEHSN